MGTLGAAQIAPLTSLRAFAALIVVAYHTKRQFGPGLILERHTALFSKGYLGVDFFFVLSGFIIAYVYRDELRSFALTPYLRFLANRIARLWPLHAATIALSASYLVVVRGEPSLATPGEPAPEAAELAAALVANLTLTHNWWGDWSAYWNPPAWSVSCEWFAYLLFPAVLAVSPLGGAIRPLAALGALALLLWASAPWTILGGIGFGLPRIALEFAMGVQLYRLHEAMGPPEGRIGDVLATATAAALLVALHFSHHVADALLAAGFAALILFAARARGPFAAALSAPWLVHLGEISYAAYMSHWLIGRLIWPDLAARFGLEALPAPAAWIVMFAAVGLLSALLHAGVERPGRRWLRAALDPARGPRLRPAPAAERPS